MSGSGLSEEERERRGDVNVRCKGEVVAISSSTGASCIQNRSHDCSRENRGERREAGAKDRNSRAQHPGVLLHYGAKRRVLG